MRVLIAIAMLTAAALPAHAREIKVEMKNMGTGGMMVFEPAFVQAGVGDTIRFLPTTPGHNAETIDGMVPAGVAPSAGAMSQEFDLKITKPGLYGVKCKPHFSMGMVALVQAGAPVNKTAVSAIKLPPLAAKRTTPLLAAVH